MVSCGCGTTYVCGARFTLPYCLHSVVTPTPIQIELLRLIAERGTLPREEVDGRSLRPLLGRGWVRAGEGGVEVTAAGRSFLALRRELTGEAAAARGPRPQRLSAAQSDFLWYLLRQTGPVPVDHVDGRILRSLVDRGMVQYGDGWVSPTVQAEAWLAAARSDTHRMPVRGRLSPRAEAMLRALDQLEAAVPRDAEILLGEQPAYADDVIIGLRRLARCLLQTGAPPKK